MQPQVPKVGREEPARDGSDPGRRGRLLLLVTTQAALVAAVSRDPRDLSLNSLSTSDNGDQALGNASQFSSVAQLCLTLCDPRDCSMPASLSITNSGNLLRIMYIMSVMPSNHLTLCHPPLLLPSVMSSPL